MLMGGRRTGLYSGDAAGESPGIKRHHVIKAPAGKIVPRRLIAMISLDRGGTDRHRFPIE
jgi:hypothetical protein